MSLFVGVDGGGTRATALVTDASGRVLARVEGGAGLVDAASPTAGTAALADLVRAALAGAGATPPAAALCCALAGAGREEERQQVERALASDALASRAIVTTDAEAGFHDAFPDGPGILLIAGTGSIAWARDGAGTMFRVGGWGHIAGDEGSGYAIGLAAFRDALRMHDGRATRTSLLDAALAHAGLRSPDDISAWLALAAKSAVASFAPEVAQRAEEDAAAAAIVEHAVADLVRHVAAARRRIGTPPDVVAVALAGGLVARGRPLHRHVTDALAAVPGSSVAPVEVDGARGAAALARTSVRT